MSIVEKLFHHNESQVNVVKRDDEMWFNGKDIANALGYENPGKAIRIHVDSDDKMPIDELLTVFKEGLIRTPLLKEAPNQGSLLKPTIKGLLSTSMSQDCKTLNFTSKLESAKVFMKWVTSEVLPSIRKNGFICNAYRCRS